MMVRPARWLYILFVVPLCAFIGMAFSGHLRDGPPQLLVQPALLGAAIGLVIGYLVVLYRRGDDLRLRAVEQMQPDAVLAQVWANPKLLSELSRITATPVKARQFTVAFDRLGITFWRGSAAPERVLVTRWGNVEYFDLGGVEASTGYPVTPGFDLELSDERLDADLHFAVDAGPRGIRQARVASEAQRVVLFDRIRRLRGMPAPSHTVSSENFSAGIVIHPTAFAARRFAFLPPSLLGALFAPIILGGLGALETVIGPAFLVLGGVPLLYGFVTNALLEIAQQRERAAGYTTLGTANFDLEQRHHRTGERLRVAGAPPLSSVAAR